MNRDASSVQRFCEYRSCRLSALTSWLGHWKTYLVGMYSSILGISKQSCRMPNLFLMRVDLRRQKLLAVLYSLEMFVFSHKLHVLL